MKTTGNVDKTISPANQKQIFMFITCRDISYTLDSKNYVKMFNEFHLATRYLFFRQLLFGVFDYFKSK